MKISILSHDLSHNCLGRAYNLAKVLQRSYEIEIIGPTFGEGIWKPVDTDEFTYKSVPGYNYPKFIFSTTKLLEVIDGDIIYAIKPRPTSFGIGILKKLSTKKPVVLDIDDWEVGFSLSSKYNFINKFITSARFPNGLSYTCLLEKLTFLANDITVSSTFLQRRFQGTIIPHGRDTNAFDPKKFDGSTFRKTHGFSDEKLILFVGTVRPHKGLEELLQAIQKLKRQDVKLVIVGASDDRYTLKLRKIGGKNIKMYGMQPFAKIPEFLSMADMVVLPQRDNFSTIGQVPSKVFDAMAMGKPIIATDVSDLPLILDGCGLISEAGNVESLINNIQYILDNSNEASILGSKAREKCVQNYSWDAMQRELESIFNKYV